MKNVACVMVQPGENVSWMRPFREAVAEGQGIRQQVREQMLRTEREWVVNVPEKDIELEKRSVGTDSGEDMYMVTGIIIIAILLAGFVVLLRQASSARHPLLPETA